MQYNTDTFFSNKNKKANRASSDWEAEAARVLSVKGQSLDWTTKQL